MTKIDIISGFLGAGKTTLIKRLLATHYMMKKLFLLKMNLEKSVLMLDF